MDEIVQFFVFSLWKIKHIILLLINSILIIFVLCISFIFRLGKSFFLFDNYLRLFGGTDLIGLSITSFTIAISVFTYLELYHAITWPLVIGAVWFVVRAIGLCAVQAIQNSQPTNFDLFHKKVNSLRGHDTKVMSARNSL